MKKIGMIVGLVAVFAMPATALAKPSQADKRNASKECRAERTAMGTENFNAKYGYLGKCVSRTAREEARERAAARRAAVKECKAANKSGRALATCVAKESKANKAEQDAEDRQERNAAKTCRDEETALGKDAFREKYGTNRGKSNAFGKCVSATASENVEQQPETQGGDQQPSTAQPPVQQPA